MMVTLMGSKQELFIEHLLQVFLNIRPLLLQLTSIGALAEQAQQQQVIGHHRQEITADYDISMLKQT